MTLGGTLTAEQVTKQVEKQLVAAVADSVSVPIARVHLLSFASARRRLLALAVTLRILAASAEEATSLQRRVETADLQV